MTATQATEIISAWTAGSKYAEACMAAGLTKAQAATLKQDPDWLEAYEKARNAFVASGLRSIAEHGKVDWKATAWLLERVKPERFAKRDAVDHTVRVEALPWRSALTGEVIDAKDVRVAALPAEAESAKPDGEPA